MTEGKNHGEMGTFYFDVLFVFMPLPEISFMSEEKMGSAPQAKAEEAVCEGDQKEDGCWHAVLFC